MLLISSCLLGLRTKYDGTANTITELVDFCRSGQIVHACPEQLGGCPTPRPPAEITGGDGCDVLEGRATVINRDGHDVGKAFQRGAEETLRLCQQFGVKAAILKERSPSCGSHCIYDGSFGSSKVPGVGVTTALLTAHGITVYSEEQLTAQTLAALLEHQ